MLLINLRFNVLMINFQSKQCCLIFRQKLYHLVFLSKNFSSNTQHVLLNYNIQFCVEFLIVNYFHSNFLIIHANIIIINCHHLGFL